MERRTKAVDLRVRAARADAVREKDDDDVSLGIAPDGSAGEAELAEAARPHPTTARGRLPVLELPSRTMGSATAGAKDFREQARGQGAAPPRERIENGSAE